MKKIRAYFIYLQIINRTMAAVLISTLALATLSIVGERPSLPEIISWLDVETLLLLFSMMLLVAIMAETGMFDFLAVFTFEVSELAVVDLAVVDVAVIDLDVHDLEVVDLAVSGLGVVDFTVRDLVVSDLAVIDLTVSD